MYIPPVLLTCKGREFNFMRPEDFEFDIEEISHALSNICRFAGHSSDFYSVAQHSVVVGLSVPFEAQLAGLMHDAAEAFLGDVPTPLKHRLAGYVDMEHHIQRAIEKQYGIDVLHKAVVKEYDLKVLAAEKRDLMRPTMEDWTVLKGVTPIKATIRPWSPALADETFLESFYAYGGTQK